MSRSLLSRGARLSVFVATTKDATARESLDASLAGLVVEWLVLAICATIVGAVALDIAGVPLRAGTTMIAALAMLALVLLPVRRWRRRLAAERGTALALLVMAGIVGWRLIAPVWPDLLPLGDGPDATHHTALANHLADNHHLVHDRETAAATLIEMAHYPPGFAILAAIGADALGVEPVRMVYPLAALAVALGILGVALLATITVNPARRPLAVGVALLALLMPTYTLGIIMQEQYYPQALAQALIVMTALVTARQVLDPRVSQLVRLTLILAALALVYTTWLPVALLVVGLGLLARSASWPRRGVEIGVATLPAAIIAALYALPRAGVGDAILLHEGSTIRDPQGAMGLALPLLAALGSARGLCRARWAGLALIVAAVAQIVALWLLWQYGAIAGYIYYKSYYLLALVLPLPIAWLVADGLPRARPAWLRFGVQSAAPAGLAVAVLWASALPTRSAPIAPGLLQVADVVRQTGRGGETDYALQNPGVAAYWLHVGALRQPRGERALELLTAPPLRFEEWYFNPESRPLVILEQPAPPDWASGLTTLAATACCVALAKNEQYQAALRELQPLLMSFRASVGDGRVLVLTHIFDQLNQPHQVRLTARQGATALAAHTLDVPQRAERVQYVGFVLDPATLGGFGYTNATEVAFESAPVGREYDLALQLIHDGVVAREASIGMWRDALTITQPFGYWAWRRPSGDDSGMTQRDWTLGEAIALVGSAIDTPVVSRGEAVRARLMWQGRASIDQPLTTFVQLIAADGGAAVSVEGEPANGSAPVWRWQPGDVISDEWSLTTPASLVPGTYQLVVGMYDPRTGQRLAAWQHGPHVERFWTDALPLGTVEVRP